MSFCCTKPFLLSEYKVFQIKSGNWIGEKRIILAFIFIYFFIYLLRASCFSLNSFECAELRSAVRLHHQTYNKDAKSMTLIHRGTVDTAKHTCRPAATLRKAIISILHLSIIPRDFIIILLRATHVDSIRLTSRSKR